MNTTLIKVVLAPLFISGCIATSGENVTLIKGPPVETVQTPYDRLVGCIAAAHPMRGVWAVGDIVDATGKFSAEYAGTGKYITQGAGDMMQTTLLQAKAETIVNRRDPRPLLAEINLGIRNPKNLMVMDYYITGSINTLDFIPGAAAEVTVAGIGPRYRQNRAVVGLDLHLTEAGTSRVLAATQISKQIYADEAGFGIGRFFGDTLVNLDISGQNREPLQLSLRAMLQFGLYEMLAQLNPGLRPQCQPIVEAIEGVEDNS
ncbi:MAG: hypothetical protein CMN55_13185 [Sneathiella sp.]|jgi:curli biogenesis system outer membrane secretion channel CsgG|uniref:CsgG/HfaB family protein n=1 Tax=Sneathiella sp. TaxID=1964365 RepID=UPI000C42F362|nr:CsgG/HfaB family protein [Sneathiella sp.]MAL80043.1 hypothetical protein [Sneathiella sp.]